MCRDEKEVREIFQEHKAIYGQTVLEVFESLAHEWQPPVLI